MGLLDRASQRLLDGLRLRVRSNVTSTDQGGQRSENFNSGLEFADHREYVPGDDVRQIDWKAFIRSGVLTVRTFEEERDVRIFVLVDASASMRRGDPVKMDVGRKVAAALGYLGMKQFDRVQIIPFTDVPEMASPAMRTRAEFPVLERFLADIEPDGVTTFAKTARTFVQRHPSRGLLIVVTDLMETADWTHSLRLLARAGHQILVVRVTCKEDDEPSFRGEMELEDAETGERVRVSMNRSLLKAYREEVAEHVERCADTCVRIGARLVHAPVEQPLESILREALATATEAR